MFNYWFRRSAYYAEHYARPEQLGRLVRTPGVLNILALGSTQIRYALDFAAAGCAAAESLAFDVQPFLYDWLLLKKYAGSLRPGGVVILGVCPFSFLLWDLSAAMRRTPRFKRYYFLLDADELPGYDPGEYRQVVEQPFWSRNWSKVFKPCRREPGALPEDKAIPDAGQLQSNAAGWIDDWQRNFFAGEGFDRLLKPEIPEKNTNLLRQMITFASAQKLRVKLLLPPVSGELNSCLRQCRLEKYLYEPLQRAVEGTPGQVLDYLQAGEFARAEYFRDALLLNKPGRRLFTQQVLAAVSTGDK